MTQTKQIINLLLLNHFYPYNDIIPTNSKRKSDELVYTVSVTRYGPQSVAQRNWSMLYQTIILSFLFQSRKKLVDEIQRTNSGTARYISRSCLICEKKKKTDEIIRKPFLSRISQPRRVCRDYELDNTAC